jgi:hypothetical protein
MVPLFDGIIKKIDVIIQEVFSWGGGLNMEGWRPNVSLKNKARHHSSRYWKKVERGF